MRMSDDDVLSTTPPAPGVTIVVDKVGGGGGGGGALPPPPPVLVVPSPLLRPGIRSAFFILCYPLFATSLVPYLKSYSRLFPFGWYGRGDDCRVAGLPTTATLLSLSLSLFVSCYMCLCTPPLKVILLE
mmetsp:Transcript_28721/g.63207  ORF Transcript_28721/g.63207 Transcript_28721/m.63207 type:complete len:129 (-) Transcript_28721:189-575(-)